MLPALDEMLIARRYGVIAPKLMNHSRNRHAKTPPHRQRPGRTAASDGRARVGSNTTPTVAAKMRVSNPTLVPRFQARISRPARTTARVSRG